MVVSKDRICSRQLVNKISFVKTQKNIKKKECSSINNFTQLWNDRKNRLFIFFPTIVFGGAQGDFLYTGFEYTTGNLSDKRR